jgi:hypothetical protein
MNPTADPENGTNCGHQVTMASKSRWWRWGALTLLTIAVTRMMRRRAEPLCGEDGVDQTLDDSFPASDPPAWTSTTGVRTRVTD